MNTQLNSNGGEKNYPRFRRGMIARSRLNVKFVYFCRIITRKRLRRDASSEKQSPVTGKAFRSQSGQYFV